MPERAGWRSLAILLALIAVPVLAMPPAAEQARDKARVALARGDGIAADADLQRAAAAGASRIEIAADMGEAKLLQGDLAKARQWLGPGEFAAPDRARGWRLRGVLERLDGNLPIAGQAFDRALALSPNDPALWVEIARLRFQGGEQLQAIEAADRAFAAGPEDIRAIQFKAQLIVNSAGPGAALALYKKGAELAPNNLSLLGDYAAALGDAGQSTAMLAVTRHMIAIDDGNVRAFYLQAVLAARAGDLELARAMLARTGNRLNTMPAAMLLQGVLELEAGNANVAAQVLGDLLARQPANTEARDLLALALYRSSDARFQSVLGAAAARDDASNYLVTLLARALEEKGDRAAAAPLLDRASLAAAPTLRPIAASTSTGVLALGWRDAPGSAMANADYLRSLLSAGQTQQAQQVAGQFLTRFPGSAIALGLAGDADLLAGNPQSAANRYANAARVRQSEQLALRQAIAFEQAGAQSRSVALAGSFVNSRPGSWLLARVMANRALDSGDFAQAGGILTSLRGRGANRDARVLGTLALAQLRGGDAAAATVTARRAFELAPAAGYVATIYALCAAQAGDTETARQLIAFAAKTGGDPRILDEARRKSR